MSSVRRESRTSQASSERTDESRKLSLGAASRRSAEASFGRSTRSSSRRARPRPPRRPRRRRRPRRSPSTSPLPSPSRDSPESLRSSPDGSPTGAGRSSSRLRGGRSSSRLRGGRSSSRRRGGRADRAPASSSERRRWSPRISRSADCSVSLAASLAVGSAAGRAAGRGVGRGAGRGSVEPLTPSSAARSSQLPVCGGGGDLGRCGGFARCAGGCCGRGVAGREGSLVGVAPSDSASEAQGSWES